MHNYTKRSSLIILQSIEAVARTCAVKKVFFRNVAKFTGKHLCRKKNVDR